MTKKIFRSILLVSGVVLLASLLVIMGCLYEYFGIVQDKQLREELDLAAAAVEAQGIGYLESLKTAGCRLSLIDPDGTVRFDTTASAETLENHLDRTEVAQALSSGEGSSKRYSSTLLEQTIYHALRLSDGSVLRISRSRATVGVLALGMLQPILVVLLIALALGFFLAKRLSERIVAPLNSLDLDKPLDQNSEEELAPLLNKLNHKQKELSAQSERLKAQREVLSKTFGGMRQAIVILDEEGRTLFGNAAAQRLFGNAAEEGNIFAAALPELSEPLASAAETERLKVAVGGQSIVIFLSRLDSAVEHGTAVLAMAENE